MSDPFERLRDGGASDPAPDVEAIRKRARRIVRRRQVGLGAGAASVAAVVLVAAFVSLGGRGDDPRPLAGPQATERSQEDGTELEALEGAGTQGEPRAPAPGGEASPDAARDQTTAAARAAADAGEGGVLEAKVSVQQQAIGAVFTLEVCNTSGDAIERSFGDAQRYDFEVSRDDEVVWRWSDGRFFAQVVGSESWGPGECKEWSERWDGRAASGAPAGTGPYEVVGSLAGAPEVRSDPEGFCLGVC